ncbi:exodeoxyribonuclease VII large subunit [Corynebacterium aquilae]|uniref:Exodeoxyribonuclease 7 large subunit n=1 Tax=Corynebacterium aquilae DSM 44791 TaxID=1431546 RepID=A0A1L7CF50_9CORY|nr:exodeoxyribonuclease VII large subunit [Corynebacterium aquilae]APT84454.1 exodeoxyribonuclease VII large subunit [Corynebacterium aquilae DSM 44791]
MCPSSVSSSGAGAKPSPDSPWPVREVNQKVKEWIERLGHLWVEGQVTQVNAKPSWRLSYLTLRDPQEEASVQVTCSTSLLANMATPIKDGDRVVVYGKPAFYAGRGSFSLWVSDIRHVGVGELLARIEQLRSQLFAEGLCDPRRKKPLPFLPRRVGLITGRGSAAERDVLAVASARWPAVDFAVINTAVQGANAVPEIVAALQTLSRTEGVDVIIIARGGGSVEDLLPFSQEALARAVVDCPVPVISAIGHEPDHPVLDDVADVRAATPTDAAKKAVPDVQVELDGIAGMRDRAAQALRGWVRREQQSLEALRSRPVLADPCASIEARREEVLRVTEQMRRQVRHTVASASAEVSSLRARVSALGPSATLARGYAVVQAQPKDGQAPFVVTSFEQAPPATQLRIRVADGSLVAVTMASKPAD